MDADRGLNIGRYDGWILLLQAKHGRKTNVLKRFSILRIPASHIGLPESSHQPAMFCEPLLFPIPLRLDTSHLG